jgi:hypothetical protein
MTTKKPPVVLAFSGGLDTSFCVPYLRERGHDVITLFVDTGGVDPAELAYIEARARELGAVEHVTHDGAQAIWDSVVVPLVIGGQLYQDVYPLLVSDRYIIVEQSLALADARGTRLFAHGCTGMGNDQVRFDQTVRSLGDYDILAPIRDIQGRHAPVRVYEAEFLKARGFDVRAKTARYSINVNLLGVTASGSEIDEFEAPGDETRQMCAHPSTWPREPLRVTIDFENGEAVGLDGEAVPGPELLRRLNAMPRRLRRRSRDLHRRHHDRPQGSHRVRVPRHHRPDDGPPRARGGDPHQPSEQLQAAGRPQVGRAGLPRLLLRTAQGRPRGVPARQPALRQRQRHARDPRRRPPADRRPTRRTSSATRAPSTPSPPTGAPRRPRASSACTA